MFGLGPMELIVIGVMGCMMFVAPLAIVIVLIRVLKADEPREPPQRS